MRINKYLAACELGSRRKVEELILNKLVKVNDALVTDLSYQVNALDIVKVNETIVRLQENKVYIMLYKPKNYITTTKEQFKRPYVLQLLSTVQEKVYPVGRLDYNTEGLLLLTNDGDFANKIISPKNEIEKEYEVIFSNLLNDRQLNDLQTRMVIDGYSIKPAKIKNVQKLKTNEYKLNIIIHEGRNRQIRKMFELVNLKIINLKRIRIGNLHLGSLKTGAYRYLAKDEINKIFE